MKRASIAIVGAGRLGTALAKRLAEAGYNIVEIRSRGSSRPPRATADLVWFCLPDAVISRVASQFRDLKIKIAFHSSGVLTGDALQTLRDQGAAVASVHPLMTFVSGSIPSLAEVPFAVEGDEAAVRVAFSVARNLGGSPFRIQKQNKVAYHAFATMICPLLVSLLAAAESTAELSNLSRRTARHRMMAIIRQTLTNYVNLGPQKAFSGPIVRGDTQTIDQHLKALSKAPAAKRAYIALAQAALEYLPSRNSREIARLLRKPGRGKSARKMKKSLSVRGKGAKNVVH